VNTSRDHNAKVGLARRPVLAASAAVFRGREVLLVRRGQKLGYGLWSLPGGKVEFGEQVAEAASREVLEETGVHARVVGFAGLYEITSPEFHYVIVAHAAVFEGGEVQAASDAAEAKFVDMDFIEDLELAPNTATAIHKAWVICQI